MDVPISKYCISALAAVAAMKMTLVALVLEVMGGRAAESLLLLRGQ